MDLKLQQKIYTKADHIIYSLCRYAHVDSYKNDFFLFYVFSIIYYDFQKLSWNK